MKVVQFVLGLSKEEINGPLDLLLSSRNCFGDLVLGTRGYGVSILEEGKFALIPLDDDEVAGKEWRERILATFLLGVLEQAFGKKFVYFLPKLSCVEGEVKEYICPYFPVPKKKLSSSPHVGTVLAKFVVEWDSLFREISQTLKKKWDSRWQKKWASASWEKVEEYLSLLREDLRPFKGMEISGVFNHGPFPDWEEGSFTIWGKRKKFMVFGLRLFPS